MEQCLDEIGVMEARQRSTRGVSAGTAADPQRAFCLEVGDSVEEESDEPLSQQAGDECGGPAAVWMWTTCSGADVVGRF